MFIVKTRSASGIESCGFVVKDQAKMEKYCARVKEYVSGVYSIMVYTCDDQLMVNIFPRAGVGVYGPGMKLYKEIRTGLACKVKR